MNLGPYDSRLQQHREPPCVPNVERLRFVRWLVDTRRLEHAPAGPPSGPWVVLVKEGTR